ncbi:DUF6499 domain-containing protein [Mesorhizobium sp. M1E.F.Ca.ET.063.01.1.1]|uniref:transcriptional regulator domain-containing protein n=1 Tax=Mesorhizobium sp. M1E.F.Ca.ET.063.01.1.1 TaxID=2496750 RepID=UPI000FCC55BF|nr:DUF6499 domain-containing protein [Mesorhizobium sp. M1E.F.Ca.ET.063.01.1.1]RUW85909.1 hypothetical protein EOA29_02670 [Mesorhizobium sp. M1E.F.Ca.ET.063.01.1.1]
MKPDTSRWRESNSYDFFDSLSVEGLAWECLRRSESYQQHYTTLLRSGTERLPLVTEEQKRWGLRFRGAARFVRIETGRFVVTSY